MFIPAPAATAPTEDPLVLYAYEPSMKGSNSAIDAAVFLPKTSSKTWATSSSGALTAYGLTSLRWWSTMPIRASTMSYAAKIFSTTPLVKSTYSGSWAFRRRNTSM